MILRLLYFAKNKIIATNSRLVNMPFVRIGSFQNTETGKMGDSNNGDNNDGDNNFGDNDKLSLITQI